jgi:antitoxin (DNA-binding transcriptional repressor) of toxin-antitoxin stability system
VKTISATEASRRFSEILDRVRLQRESFVIIRRGEAVARIDAVPSAGKSTTLGELMRMAARVRTNDHRFAADLEAIQSEQPGMGGDPWQS